ncbi:hypothetical protein [Thermoactinomyces sp. DSM 45892]|nr:hypothetical protein [Thermoactinomyces sp. DSM 45892]SDY88842.1 hypothetical protein SAMN05444416_109178 [Thermoactinomyces sp. DSM 45892]
MAERLKRIIVRFSNNMIERLCDAEEREGIDRSSLIVSYIYQLVESKTDKFDISYALLDIGKDANVDIGISGQLKSQFQDKIDTINKNQGRSGVNKLTLSNIVASRLIQFVIMSERKAAAVTTK